MELSTNNETQSGNSQGDAVDLVMVWRWIWARRWTYILIGFVCCALAVGYSFIVPKQYTGQVIMLPKIPVQKAGLLGPLAALAGESTVLEGVDEELYGQILASDFILDRAVKRTWSAATGEETETLFEVFGLDEGSSDRSLEFRTFQLKTILRVQVIRFERDPITGIMAIRATVPGNPRLAAELANFLADELDEFNGNLNARRTVKHKKFVEGRLQEVQKDLESSEARLTDFLLENSRYNSSPKLTQRYGELERDVQAYRAIWLQMRTQLETAKIDVNKDIDSINILDRAEPPLFRSAPNRRLFLLVGGVFGFLLATLVALARSRYVRT